MPERSERNGYKYGYTCPAMQRLVFEVGGHLVRLSANICQLHRPNTIPIFCAAVCRDYRLRTFIGFNPKFLQSYDHCLTAGTGSDKLNRGLDILFDEVDICLCVLREILEGLAAGQVTEVSVELFVYRLAALQEL